MDFRSSIASDGFVTNCPSSLITPAPSAPIPPTVFDIAPGLSGLNARFLAIVSRNWLKEVWCLASEIIPVAVGKSFPWL